MDTHQCHLTRKILVRLGLHAEPEELVILARLVRVLVVEPSEILPRHRVDDVCPDLPPDLAVLVQNAVVCEAAVDAHQGIEEASHVGDASGQAETAAVDAVWC